MAEKWSKKVDVKEGALTDIGWPSASKISAAISSGRVSYKTAISRLNYLANITKDAATKRRARSIIVTLQRKHGKGPAKRGK